MTIFFSYKRTNLKEIKHSFKKPSNGDRKKAGGIRYPQGKLRNRPNSHLVSLHSSNLGLLFAFKSRGLWAQLFQFYQRTMVDSRKDWTAEPWRTDGTFQAENSRSTFKEESWHALNKLYLLDERVDDGLRPFFA